MRVLSGLFGATLLAIGLVAVVLVGAAIGYYCPIFVVLFMTIVFVIVFTGASVCILAIHDGQGELVLFFFFILMLFSLSMWIAKLILS
ncbi:MAG: hypothetical protein Q7S36_00800 [Candidatus Liptonbacteria bacterium]|nr:hypothetical protein [Candidatus Liptonbacteria bacterium]